MLRRPLLMTIVLVISLAPSRLRAQDTSNASQRNVPEAAQLFESAATGDRRCRQGLGLPRGSSQAASWYTVARSPELDHRIFLLDERPILGESSPPGTTGSSIVATAEELRLAPGLSRGEQRDGRPNPGFQTAQRGRKKNPRDETGDLTQAQKHYDNRLKKARDGDVRAQFDVGMALLTGEGTTRDPRAAAEWFRRAADSGDPQAQTRLGYLYSEGIGVDRDSAEAVRWFLRAAVSGYAPAEYDLGMAYLNGTGGHEDAPGGIRWLLKAAEAGVPEAQHNLGLIYAEGRPGIMRDPALGRRWLTAAAKRGNPCAEYNLGVLYNTGLGVAVDAKEAQKWFRRAVSHVGQKGTMADLARSCGSGPDAH